MEILQNIWMSLTTENELVLNLTGIPFVFIEAYISMLIFTTLFDIKSSKKAQILYVISLSILSIITRCFIPDPYCTFFNLLLCPILIICIFRVNVLIAVISEFIPVILESVISFFLLKILLSIFNLTYSQVLYTPIFRIIASVLEYSCMFIIYIIIKKCDIKLKLLNISNNKNKIILFLNFALGILAISLQIYINTFYYKNLFSSSIIVFCAITLIMYFIISFYSLISTNKLNIAKQNLEETRLMNKTLASLNDKIRAFRHDFNNIIQALGGYISAKDYDGLEKYYSQLLKDCQEVNNLTGLNPEAINNPAIYSLIGSKYYLATDKGIEFNLDIFMDLNSIDMKIYEFCRILGILLDNAIQATQECEEKVINVTIRKDSRNNRQLLIIENTYKDKNVDTEKIFEKGYSTKEGNTGLGLWEVRQILCKNTNLNLFTSKDNNYFKQQLEIYKN